MNECLTETDIASVNCFPFMEILLLYYGDKVHLQHINIDTFHLHYSSET